MDWLVFIVFTELSFDLWLFNKLLFSVLSLNQSLGSHNQIQNHVARQGPKGITAGMVHITQRPYIIGLDRCVISTPELTLITTCDNVLNHTWANICSSGHNLSDLTQQPVYLLVTVRTVLVWNSLIQNSYPGRLRCLYPTTSCVCSACSASPVQPAVTSSRLSTVTAAPLLRSRRSPARSGRFHTSPKCERRLQGSQQAPNLTGPCQTTSSGGLWSESWAPTRARWSPSLSGRILTSLSLRF